MVITLLNYISVAVMFACCIIISTQSASRMQRLALLSSILITICSIGFIIRFEATDANTFMAGQKICYAFVTHAMFFVILFAFEYCRYYIPKVIQCIMHGINFMITFVVLTLDHHQLFYKSYCAVTENGQMVIEKEYNFMYLVELGVIIIYILAYFIVTAIFTIKNVRKRRNYVWRMLVAMMIPCIAYFVPKIAGFTNETQNIAFAVFMIMMMYMIYRNNLYDVENIATQLSIGSMEEAFIVFDNRYRFMGCNRKAEELFPVLKNIELDSDIRLHETPFADYLDGKGDEYCDKDIIYAVSVRSITEGNITQGKVVRLEDVTVQRNYTDLLKEKQEQIETDLEMAKSIQLSALPNADHVFSSIAQLNTAAFMEAAREVGGDFYDMYMLGENKAVFLIADVSGKGIPAAMFMMQAKATIRNYVEEGLQVHDAFTKANKRLCQGNDARMFVTAWMGMLDLQTGLLSLVNAGHNSPIYIGKDMDCEYLKKKSGMALGCMEGVNYKLHELQLDHGDRFYLYTDGVTEATDKHNKLYGDERLIEFIGTNRQLSVEEMLPAVKTDIDGFVGDAEQFDDITMVIFEYI